MIELIGKGLYQWDPGRRFVSITNSEATKVHFSNPGDSKAPVIDIVNSKAPIPTYLLETGKPLRVYAVADGVTIEKREFPVTRRERPESYVYEDDQRNYIYELIQAAEEATAEAERVAEELRTARDRGEFKGDPGAVKFVVVKELPEQDTENAIYLVPNSEQGEENLFDEYVFVDGKPERIGSASVGVNLEEYVKKTDVASSDNPGVVKISSPNGIKIYAGGVLAIDRANEGEIIAKKDQYKPITPGFLDIATKVGMTTNAIEWTEDEKQAARDLIRAASTDFATYEKAGLVKSQGESVGIGINPTNGGLYIAPATVDDITKKTVERKPISPANLDYAVKVGITANKETLTEEEKAAACEWLGVDALIDEKIRAIPHSEEVAF